MNKPDREDLKKGIYDIVKTIPHGRATSYGAIAKAVGHPNLSRMVGKIMGESNSTETAIPAHRVVNSQGMLSGKEAFGNTNEMQGLLEDEGVLVVNGKIKSWKRIFWNPIEEITL